jgi:hypothetical protein
MSDERWKDDGQFEAHVIDEVRESAEHWELTFKSGWSFGIAKATGIVPKVGNLARLYGKGIGYVVRGCVVDGQVAYYRSDAEEDAKRLADIADREKKERETFEANRDDNDRRIAALPPEFNARFYRFRAHNPDHRWKFEGYELFCCEEAVRISAAAKAAKGTVSPVEWLRAFHAANVETQKKLAPDLKMSEHSGNTFGFAVQLAHCYLTEPALVEKMHGALANLVGCEEYGCPPVTA